MSTPQQPQQQQPQATVQQPQAAPPQLYLMVIMPFAVFALVLLIRAFPWSSRRFNSKPLSCDACMSFWCAFVMGIALSWFAAAHWSWSLLHLLPAPGVALLLLAVHKWLTAPRELPFGAPPFPDEPLRRKTK